MALVGVRWSETSMQYAAARYLDDRRLTHHALRDAQDQAELFQKMLAKFITTGVQSRRTEMRHKKGGRYYVPPDPLLS